MRGVLEYQLGKVSYIGRFQRFEHIYKLIKYPFYKLKLIIEDLCLVLYYVIYGVTPCPLGKEGNE